MDGFGCCGQVIGPLVRLQVFSGPASDAIARKDSRLQLGDDLGVARPQKWLEWTDGIESADQGLVGSCSSSRSSSARVSGLLERRLRISTTVIECWATESGKGQVEWPPQR